MICYLILLLIFRWLSRSIAVGLMSDNIMVHVGSGGLNFLIVHLNINRALTSAKLRLRVNRRLNGRLNVTARIRALSKRIGRNSLLVDSLLWLDHVGITVHLSKVLVRGMVAIRRNIARNISVLIRSLG